MPNSILLLNYNKSERVIVMSTICKNCLHKGTDNYGGLSQELKNRVGGRTVSALISKGRRDMLDGMLPEADGYYQAAYNTLNATDGCVECKNAISAMRSKLRESSRPAQGLGIAALIFAFLFPPVGLILAIITKNTGYDGGLSSFALPLSIILMILMLGCGCVMCAFS